MAKQSAGVLVYRKKPSGVEVLIVHPGGPFWAKKDKGAWTLPKGEFNDTEEALDAAKREFQEETGQPLPAGEYLELGTVKNKSGKTIYGWAVQGDMDITKLNSNSMMIEWPPKSGKEQEFREVDKAGWFTPDKAMQKLHPAQAPFVERLLKALGIETEKPPQQASLF
ncbi:MAG TPA: NUDIX domain-containing protein [Verrucomicrobiae bacterium]|nr:NUDIX domain-containing protein [Verrucomicrobiae bacterium]